MPVAQGGSILRLQFGGEQNGIGQLQHTIQFCYWILQMLEDLYCRDHVELRSCWQVRQVELVCKKILAMHILPIEIEAPVAHHPHEQAVAAAIVEEPCTRLEKRPDQR